MDYTPISPFKRPITHAHLRVVDSRAAEVTHRPVSKWEVLRNLSKAQGAFGLTERDLTVLQGLLSFFPATNLGGNAAMVVFPSNKAICERLNGMACSTMRRHLGRLVDTGLLIRRDSPNGKRYARRQGDAQVAFGFDLTPLLSRAGEIARAAEAVRAQEDRLQRLREVVSLMRRDLAALADFGEELRPGLGLWDELRDRAALTARALRRKLTLGDLTACAAELSRLLDQARDLLDGPETEEMITNDARSGQHHPNSDKKESESEPCDEDGNSGKVAPEGTCGHDDETEGRGMPKLPLHLVNAACPSLRTFYRGEIRHWHQLHDAARQVTVAMGISGSAWQEAQRQMGPEAAAIVVAAILERFADIRSPGGYLRALTAKAAEGGFSCGPMVMALLSRRKAG